jgi:tetratricopeptide (TPR) repeat protein
MTQYGKTFAAELNEHGDFDKALAAATDAIAREPENPDHFVDRGTAQAALEHYDAAVADFARALELDRETRTLDDDILDDSYFSALLGAARAEPVDAGVARLGGYAALFPKGRHLADARDWARRLRGELKTEFVKRRD